MQGGICIFTCYAAKPKEGFQGSSPRQKVGCARSQSQATDGGCAGERGLRQKVIPRAVGFLLAGAVGCESRLPADEGSSRGRLRVGAQERAGSKAGRAGCGQAA